MTSAHLLSDCAGSPTPCRDAACADAVKQAPSGRWFITMGHAGFNTATNNASGYRSEQDARKVMRKLLMRSPAGPWCWRRTSRC